jgi:pSer/pThr/pTyr-binding forkhead associated (FHA) protein
MAEIDPVFIKLDQLISSSRLHQLALMLNMDRADRIQRMMAALARLRPGAYLLGTGPSTSGIIPLSVEEIVLGRTATPVEEPGEIVIDYAISDTLYYGPWEASRVHAKVVRQNGQSKTEYRLLDLCSSCKTFVNGKAIGQDGRMLCHGDVVSLGPSQVSTYLFYVVSPGNEQSDKPWDSSQ